MIGTEGLNLAGGIRLEANLRKQGVAQVGGLQVEEGGGGAGLLDQARKDGLHQCREAGGLDNLIE